LPNEFHWFSTAVAVALQKEPFAAQLRAASAAQATADAKRKAAVQAAVKQAMDRIWCGIILGSWCLVRVNIYIYICFFFIILKYIYKIGI
jgi:hypothetical protein